MTGTPEDLWEKLQTYYAKRGYPASVPQNDCEDFLHDLIIYILQAATRNSGHYDPRYLPHIIRQAECRVLQHYKREQRQVSRVKQYADPFKELELHDAINTAISQMPPGLRMVCERLKYDTINKVAKDLGVSRHQIYKAIKQARAYLKWVGLP